MANLGLLFVFCEPPAAFEEELNDWYDFEHIPERLAIAGFLTALRFVSLTHERRYLAIYDLEEHAVLDTPQYAAFSGDNNTPWTRRAMARAKFTRMTGVQVSPGDLRTARTSRVLVLRFAGAPEGIAPTIEAALKASFDGKPGIMQRRIFECGAQDGVDYIAVVEGHGDLESHLDLPAFGNALEHLDLAETFRPY